MPFYFSGEKHAALKDIFIRVDEFYISLLNVV